MGQKVTFNPVTKIIQVDLAPVGGVVELDVKIDLYSDGKEDWRSTASLFKYRFPIRAVGGDPLPGSKSLGSTFFLDPGWSIRPYEGDHRMIVNGNLYKEDGSSPFTTTTGTWNILIESVVSSLVDSTVAQLAEIEYASFGGGVTIDVTSGNSGTVYPTGTPQEPVNNIADAHAIASERGFPTFFVIGDLDITAAVPTLEGHSFIGSGKDRTVIDIDAVAVVTDCAYYDAHVTGTLDGNSRLLGCVIDSLVYVKGFVEQCVISPGTIVLAGSEEAHFLDCWSGQPGTGTPIIDMGGSGQALALRNYNGGIKITNKTGTESVSIDLNSGQIKLDSTVTNGTIVCRGIGKLIDADTGEPIPSGDYNGATILNELIGENVREIHQAHFNRRTWDKTGDTLTIYDTDGSTPLHVFDTNDDMSDINPQ